MVVTLDRKNIPPSIGQQINLCPASSLPRICASLWLSQNENAYSESYTEKFLRAIDSFYEHVETVMSSPIPLDEIILKLDIHALKTFLSSYIAELQNIAAQQNIDCSPKFQQVVRFLTDVIIQIEHRTTRGANSGNEITRYVASLSSLYKFLRPPRKTRTARLH